MNTPSRGVRPLGAILASLVCLQSVLLAQLNSGAVAGTLRTSDGRPLAGEAISVTGAAGFHLVVRTASDGGFSLVLPYGHYVLADTALFVVPLATVRLELVRDPTGATRMVQPVPRLPGIWTDRTKARQYPEAFSLHGLLLSREPSSVTEPLDFTGLADNRRAVQSGRGFSWTATQYMLHGMDATDTYQPGFSVMLADVEAVDAIVVRSSFAQSTSSSYGPEIMARLSEPRPSWHGMLSTTGTGGALASDSLPPPPEQGLVQQADQFHWLTRDHAEIGGPLGKWIDVYASATGQWASQTEPLEPPGTDQRSRLLFGNARGRVRATSLDRFDALYSGSRIDLSDGGVPAGLEALTGNRMMPSFVLPGGFPGEPEVDHFDLVQVGWTRLLSSASSSGVVEVRYGCSTAHLDTSIPVLGQSSIELLGGAITGSPPLANLAVRLRHEIAASWEPPVRRARGIRYRIAAGEGWKTSESRNRFQTPSDRIMLTANGSPAFIVEFNTPLVSRARVQSFGAHLSGSIALPHSLSIDLSIMSDLSRGSLPAQSSPGSLYLQERRFAPQPHLIAWNSISPRAGLAWQVPRSDGLIVRGAYSRRYAPLAGRYLDGGNPNSLGGSIYQWTARDRAASFQPAQQGELVLRFGGPVSSISPQLVRPYADEFNLGAGLRLGTASIAGIHLFRRDEKDRIATIDRGLPARAFTPVSISDPGPDYILGTYDDQGLTVYAQDPATFGLDHYLLTNPPGLRELNTGLVAELGAEWRGLALRASFVAEKSYGPTNPGNALQQNDPGVIGGLFLDPNSAVHAAGRMFPDRAFVGKLQAAYRLPSLWGGIEIASTAGYTDGLVFARQLLVTVLPQGPIVMATTVRGSPEGGNRAEYVANWNLRVGRQFLLAPGRLHLSADILNVTNARQRIQENDLSSPSFNLRLPVALQSPRLLRFGFRYEF